MRQRMRLITCRCAVWLLLIFLIAGSVILLSSGNENFLLRFLRQTDRPYAPAAFGAFHLLSLSVCAVLAVAVGFVAWHLPEHRRECVTDQVLFAAGILFWISEWYKQLYVCFAVGNGIYDFSVFPFQFCSLPLYICPVITLLRDGRIKRALRRFLMFYGTVGGYLVMGYPDFPDRLPLCLHTVFWHSLMILLGIFLLCSEPLKGDFKREFLPAGGIFAGFFVAATLLNVWLEPIAEQMVGTLNLFYMSPYHNTYFWMISDVRQHFGWGASVACYLLLFWIAGAFPLWVSGVLFRKKRNCGTFRIKKRKKHGKS